MALNRQETTSTLRLSTAILLGCTALLLATSAHAQIVRPSNSIYVALKGGLTAYGGDLDQNYDVPSATLQPPTGTDWLTENFGFLIGPEIGYQFTESLGLGLGLNYAQYAALDSGFPVILQSSTDATTYSVNQGSETLYNATAALRYMPFPSSRLSPYVNLGAQFTFGSDNQSAEIPNSDGTTRTVNINRSVGVGPYAGVGLDYMLGDRLSLFLEADVSWIFDDCAVDGTNPGARTASNQSCFPDASQIGTFGDDSDYDNLVMYGGGLKFAFKKPYTEVEVMRLECPTGELIAGESGSFMAITNEDATPPISISWDWGDGSTGAGMSTSHTYRTPGTYTVTATAAGDYNESMDTCVVTVVEPRIPPQLTACRITPSQIGLGETVTLNGSVNNDASQPVSISVDWGDGDSDSGVTFPTRHSYSDVGSYTVTATATNAHGSDTCTAMVTVIDTFCADVSELNSVYFEFGSAALTADARERLDENLDVLRRCSDINVLIRGYTDDREDDQLRLSQARADAIRDYYVANGIDMDRLRAEGLGQDPNANSKEDPGPGDGRARRGDSIPADGMFTPTGISRR
ncbi:MAG: PKD domain-containing protein [Bacteroidota bacterium]